MSVIAKIRNAVKLLTVHGYFHLLLKESLKVATGHCKHCDGEKDTVEHTYFRCVRYSEGHPPFPNWKPEKLVPERLWSSEN